MIAFTAVAVARADPPPDAFALLPAVGSWELDLNNDLVAPPAFAGDHGYFPIAGERLAAYDIRHGTLLWVASASTRHRPATGQHLVFIVEPGQLTALHDDTGAVAWRVPIAEEVSAPPVWAGGWLIATTSSGNVLSFRASDGGAIWVRTLQAGIRPSATVAADHVFVPLEDGRIVALQIETGNILWERRLGGAPAEILALDDRVFVGSTDNYFYAIRVRDGQVLWRWATGADVVGLPVADKQRVYFVSLDNVLRALDRNNGAQRWKRALPVRPLRGPVVAGGVLLVSGIAPSAPAFHVADGTAAGSLAAGGELATAPHVLMTPGLPRVVLVTRDLARGTAVHNLIRSVEPADTPIAPLPSPIVPAGPTPPYEVRLLPLPGLIRPEPPNGPYEWEIGPLPDVISPERPVEPQEQ